MVVVLAGWTEDWEGGEGDVGVLFQPGCWLLSLDKAGGKTNFWEGKKVEGCGVRGRVQERCCQSFRRG
jgi:hypothetical protein